MSDVQHFILATAGHVDHGKSALVKALTGTDPDRLPEEKSRGITIDLGFAHLALQSPIAPFSSFLLGIVDVPGHEDFVKNMVAGVGSIDLALLVVAADDGWMPQTEEHLQILTYLGVKQAVVALTKIDLVRDEKSVTDSVREKLRDTPYADAPIIGTSIVSGHGLKALQSGLAAAVAKTSPPRDINKPRLPVDRVFNLQGIGTVVTGTLTGGALHRGQSVIVQPSGRPVRIRNIQSHNCNMEVVGPGTRAALNLPNLVPAQDIRRGDVVTLSGYGGASDIIDVLLEISPRASRPIKEAARVWVHHGSGSVPANVVFFSGKRLNMGEHALAQLRLESPAFVFAGDRFVVRDWAEQHTLAGGIVLDADAGAASFRSEARLNFLRQRAEAAGEVRSYILSELMRNGAAKRFQLLLKSRFSAIEIAETASRLVAEGVVSAVGDFVADNTQWGALRRHAIEAIDDMHRVHPEHFGMPLNDLRTILKADLPFDDMFDELIKDLCRTEFVQAGAVIRRSTHRPALPKHLQAPAAKLRAALARKPFDPPSRKELAPDAASQQALRFLIETGEAIEVNADVVMPAESEERVRELICRFIRDHGPATVSDLRKTIGSSRRVIIPLLERLDRAGVTERVDDRRALGQKR